MKQKILRLVLGFLYPRERFDHLAHRLIRWFDGGAIRSQILRDLLEKHYGIRIGAYSYGPILWRNMLTRGSTVGNWCSVGKELIVWRRNHPVDRIIQHPIFYNSGLGMVDEDMIEGVKDNPLIIGHDVWIGDRVTILPGCKVIGNGAILAAGSVVTRDVLPYTIMGGVPARQLKPRFPREIQEILEKSRWWELDADQLDPVRGLLLQPVTEEVAREFAQACHDIRQNASSRARP